MPNTEPSEEEIQRLLRNIPPGEPSFNGFARAALLFGAMSVLSFFPFLVPIPIIALAAGIIGMRQAVQEKDRESQIKALLGILLGLAFFSMHLYAYLNR